MTRITITTLNRNALLATVFFILVGSTLTIAVRNSDAKSVKDVATEKPTAATRREHPPSGHRTSGTFVAHANGETFENQVLRSRLPVLVDFYANWCGPCQIQEGILKDFAAEFDGGKIVKINVDESPELAARYDVQELPTLLIFQDGKVTARQVGLATTKQLKAALAS